MDSHCVSCSICNTVSLTEMQQKCQVLNEHILDAVEAQRAVRGTDLRESTMRGGLQEATSYMWSWLCWADFIKLLVQLQVKSTQCSCFCTANRLFRGGSDTRPTWPVQKCGNGACLQVHRVAQACCSSAIMGLACTIIGVDLCRKRTICRQSVDEVGMNSAGGSPWCDEMWCAVLHVQRPFSCLSAWQGQPASQHCNLLSTRRHLRCELSST